MESQESGGGAAGLIMAVHAAVKSGLSSAWNAVAKDGTIAAAGRQGADELGMALKAFPDSIQAEEPGTIWNPTQGEIASARNHDPTPSSSPSAIAKEGTVPGYVEGRGLILDSSAPSPSMIAKEDTASGRDMAPARDQAQPSPGEIARDRGSVLEQEKTSWVDRENDRRAQAKQDGNEDQSERAKGRSLPEEQREKEQGLGGPSRCR
ncbi:MAG: hypothetical protein LC118_10305 [Dehalococcoidia bacterium]|nr:hypothetical protein [Dehalococcoidia bacterium]